MMKIRLRITIGMLGGAAALLPATAMAQLTRAESQNIRLQEAPDVPPDPNDIVVTAGPPPKVSEVARQAETITRSDDVVTEPLARYQTPICPGIIGLPVEVAELIIDRVRYNAERAGAPLAKEMPCRPNALIVVTRDGQADVKSLMRSHGYMFANLSLQETRELEEDSRPARGWNLVSRHGRHGESISSGMEVNGARIPVLQEPMAHSRIYLTTRLEIDSGFVLLDAKAIDGLSVNQIADYATMRVLVNTRPPKGDGPVQTILTLFNENSNAPLELSEFDLAYLERSYTTMANLPAYGKLVGVARDVRKAKAEKVRAAGQARTTSSAPATAP